MRARGVHLQYRFGADLASDSAADVAADGATDPAKDAQGKGQRGAALHNPLFDLLSAVHEHGSIQRAAKAMAASYRHVWGALKTWEDTLGEPIITWTKGQPARLTPFAERLLWAETRARTRMTPHIEALRAELEHVLTQALDGKQQVLTIFASHDLGLPALRDLASQQHDLHIELRFAGSVDALRALAAGRCLVAGFHVPPLQGQGSALFAKAMKPLLKPGRHKLIGCLRRRQGLMVSAGNPKGLTGLADLSQPHWRYLNRQPGSGTRLLMDHLLQQQGISAASIPGYDHHAEDSHVAVAAAIASGAADVGPGIEAAAARFGLDFIPLVDEDYFLVCLKDALDHPAVKQLRASLANPAWPAALQALPGYQAQRAGEVLALTQALPWWHFRVAKA